MLDIDLMEGLQMKETSSIVSKHRHKCSGTKASPASSSTWVASPVAANWFNSQWVSKRWTDRWATEISLICWAGEIKESSLEIKPRPLTTRTWILRTWTYSRKNCRGARAAHSSQTSARMIRRSRGWAAQVSRGYGVVDKRKESWTGTFCLPTTKEGPQVWAITECNYRTNPLVFTRTETCRSPKFCRCTGTRGSSIEFQERGSVKAGDISNLLQGKCFSKELIITIWPISKRVEITASVCWATLLSTTRTWSWILWTSSWPSYAIDELTRTQILFRSMLKT